MLLELDCPRCRCQVNLEQIAAEGPWYALGDGETWEDRLHACLRCGDCGAPIEVSEESLAELSRELLAQW